MLIIEHLTKKYGDHIAVDHLSFKVDEGQVYGFLGPNCAGKSTTMNIMTGYLAATEGDVIINGYNILEEPEKAKRTIGYLPEIPPLYPDMTVREYLTFAAELKKVPRKEVKLAVVHAMQELSIMDVADRLIRHLSKGYKQRVGFAQAIIGDPETLILDEPTVGLDPKQIIEIRELIKSLGRRHTVILSSHILAEVSEICDTVLIMSRGRLVALDSPENLARKSAGASVTITSPVGADELRAALEGLRNVTGVDFTDDGEGTVTAHVTFEGESDPRKDIIAALTAGGCTYYSVDVQRASLEDIFLELTDSEDFDDTDDSEEFDDDEDAESQDSIATAGMRVNPALAAEEPKQMTADRVTDIENAEAEAEAEDKDESNL